MQSNTDNASSPSNFSADLQRLSNAVDKGSLQGSLIGCLAFGISLGISQAFRMWAGFVSRKPYTVIAATTIFGLIWSVAFFFTLTMELDSDDLFTPDDAESFDAKDYVDSLYGSYTDRVCHTCVTHAGKRLFLCLGSDPVHPTSQSP